MVDFVFILDSPQNGDGILHGRFLDIHLLKPSFQRCIRFNVLLVFIQGGGANDFQGTLGQFGFNNVRYIHLTLTAGTYYHMDFINKNNDITILFHDCFNEIFQAFFKLPFIHGAGYHCRKIHGDQLFLLDILRHIAFDNSFGQTFHHCCFTRTGFTN